MNSDLSRLIIVVLICFLLGLLTGQFGIAYLIGFVIFFSWQYRVLKRISRWLTQGRREIAPTQMGIVDEICRKIYYLQGKHRQRQTTLSQYLKRYQHAIMAIPDAVIVLGQGGKIEWANEKANTYLGIQYPRDTNLHIVNLVRNPLLADYLAHAHDDIEHTLQINSPIKPELMLEFRFTPYGADQALMAVRDITVIHRTDQIRKTFMENASHELRTPLTVIMGYLEGLSTQRTGEWQTQIAEMQNQARRMQYLIEGLLHLSGLENASSPPAEDTVAVPEMLADIRQEMHAFDPEGRCTFHMDIDQDLYIQGDPQDFYSAFSNLIINAVQYTSGKAVIHIRWYRDQEGVHLAVRDNGLGIATRHIDRLTERFYRVETSRARTSGGTGLGLAIVKHVLERYAGSLYIEGNLGHGALFRCDLPSSCIYLPQ